MRRYFESEDTAKVDWFVILRFFQMRGYERHIIFMKGCQLQKRMGTYGLCICRTKTEVLPPEPSANKNKQYPCMVDAGADPAGKFGEGGGRFQ